MIFKLIITRSICVLSFVGNAQIFGKQNLYPNKIQIGISTSGYSFFDGYPMFLNALPDNYSYLAKTRGLEIIYFVNDKSGIRLSYNKVQIYYPIDLFYPVPFGSIDFRDFHLFHAEFVKTIFSRKYLLITLEAGMSYRYGSESYIIAYGAFDIHVESKLLKDIGLSIGPLISIPIVKGLYANIGFKYTSFIYRNNTGGSIYYEDIGSSQQMFAISLGAGYSFGFKKKQKGFSE